MAFRYHAPRLRKYSTEDSPQRHSGAENSQAADGRYRFRTIKPVAYPRRGTHIHVAVRVAGNRPLITQMYVRRAPENRWHWLLNGVADDAARERLIVDFEPADDCRSALLRARFATVLTLVS